MARNLKALGLALVAVFAFGAVAASGASATNFTAENTEGGSAYPATLMGEQVAGELHKFIFSEGNKAELTCESAIFHSRAGEPLKAASESISVTPTYSGCHAIIAGITKDVTVTHNECWFTFNVSGAVEVKCPAGVKGIEIHVYNNAADHTPPTDKPLCTYTVKPQAATSSIAGQPPVTWSNMTNGTAPKTDATANVHAKVSVTRTSGSALLCGPETQNATYTGNTTVRATNSEEKTIDFHLL